MAFACTIVPLKRFYLARRQTLFYFLMSGTLRVWMLPQDIPRLTLTRPAHPYLPPSFRLLHSAAKGLARVHSCGKVHGDIKPSNIVLVPNNGNNSNTMITFTAKITDFGFTVGEKTKAYF